MINGNNSLYRGDVTGLLNSISMSEMGFIALDVFKPAMADSPTDYFWKVGPEQLLRMPTPRTARGARPQRDKYSLSQDTYATIKYEEEAELTADESAEIVDFSLAAFHAKIKANELLRAQEKRVADLCMDTTAFPDDSGAATGMTPSVKWDVQGTGTPIEDITRGKQAIRKKCGKTPDTLVVGDFIFDRLCINKQVRESAVGLRYVAAYNRGAVLPPDALAEALGVKRVLKANALYMTSNKAQSFTADYIWDQDKAFLCCTDESVVRDGNGKLILGEPCIGRTIGWNAYGGMLEVNQYGERVDDQIINVRQHVQEKRLLTACGFLFYDIMT